MNHCPEEKRKTNPRETANIFSVITFAFVAKLLTKGFKRDLKDEDLYEVINRLKSERCGNKLEKCWQIEKDNTLNKGKSPSVNHILWRRWGKRYLFLGFIDFVYGTITNIMKPWAISNLISFFVVGQTTITKNEAYFYGSIFILLTIVRAFYTSNYYLWAYTIGMEMKTSFSSLLYRKSLKLTPSALSEISLGNIVTMITKDVQSFISSIWAINDTWVSSLQVVNICILLMIKVGPVAIFGIGITMLALPFQAYTGKWITKLRLQTSKKTDQRLQLVQEVLSTMRVIKMYTWEPFFVAKINETRKKEISKLLLGYYLKSVLISVGILFSKIGFYVLILGSMWCGVTTDTSVIMYCMTTFRDLRYWLGIAIPYAMGQFGEFLSAYRRISKTLEAEELEPNVAGNAATEKPFIELKEATVMLKEMNIVKDVSMSLNKGLTILTGPVGSGKSSLLKAILQDYPLSSGTLMTDGRISYASQDPWLFPSTIRQNIVFGLEYNERRYQEVISVCALLFDFNLFEQGDQTIVTDRGLNLSKGQQARINLARAIYRESEIYLLDDCLTALDASVQDYIFQECIKKYLKDKIVVLVSQNTGQIYAADTIVIMNEGKIEQMGTPSNKIIEQVKNLVVEDDDLEKEVIEDDGTENEVGEKSRLLETEITNRKKIYKEVKKEGAVDYGTYKKYLLYGGGFVVMFLNVCGAGITQYAFSFSEKLLTMWIDKQENYLNLDHKMKEFGFSSNISASVLNDALQEEKSTFRLYSTMIVVSTILELCMLYSLITFCRRASINIHKAMVKKVINAVMSFFDTHLIGNVLNRFSQDMVNIDENLPMILYECYVSLFECLGALVLIVLVSFQFTIYIAVMLIAVILLRWVYLPTGRSLKRLEAVTRSPMIGHLNATLEGLTTIRACKMEEVLINEYDRHQDLYSSAYYMSIATQRGVGFMMDVMGCIFLSFVVIKFLFFSTDVTAGEVALAVTQVYAFVREFQWGIRQSAELENNMTSVERVIEYTKTKTEHKDGITQKNWPTSGAITYENVSLSYHSSDDYVLKNLNFTVQPKERIGIVGRTGAGKSSVISTIFRLYEAEGKIRIDGVDIKTLSLDFLRKNLAIIPQDPILFTGTIRTNLDPLKEFSDAELWDVLEKVSMKHLVISLAQEVNSISSNFSLGQKQLICLARAILHKNKIVIMDEASANMDHKMDAALHTIMKENFVDATVLTIAHRLHTILECDKVMVLDRGEIKEFSDPASLLEDKNGLFYKMVRQANLLDYLN